MYGSQARHRAQSTVPDGHAARSSPHGFEHNVDQSILDLSLDDFKALQEQHRIKQALVRSRKLCFKVDKRAYFHVPQTEKRRRDDISSSDYELGSSQTSGQGSTPKHERQGEDDDRGYTADRQPRGRQTTAFHGRSPFPSSSPQVEHPRGRTTSYAPARLRNRSPVDLCSDVDEGRSGTKYLPTDIEHGHTSKQGRPEAGRSRSVGSNSRNRGTSQTRTALFQAPRIQAVLRKQVENDNRRWTQQSGIVQKEYDNSDGDYHVTPDLAQDSDEAPRSHIHSHNQHEPGNLASASGHRSYHNSSSEAETSDPSSPHLDGQLDPMSNAVAPLLRSSAPLTKTHRRKRQITHRNAASSGISKTLGKIGIESAHPVKRTSLGSQFDQTPGLSSGPSAPNSSPFVNHHSNHTPSPSLSLDHHSEHLSAPHKNIQCGNAKPVIASYTPFSQNFNNEAKSDVTNIAPDSDSEMAGDGYMTTAEILENALRKQDKTRLREQALMNGDPYAEEVRSLGKQQHRKEGYHAAEHRQVRKLVEQAEYGEQKKKQERAENMQRKAEEAAHREKKRTREELYAKAIKANRTNTQTAQDHVGGHPQLGEHRKGKHPARKDSGLEISRRLTPQHGTPPPRQCGKRPETISISSDESSSDTETDEQVSQSASTLRNNESALSAKERDAREHMQERTRSAIQELPRSNLKRSLDNSDGERMQSNKKVRFLTPSSERRLEETRSNADPVPQSRSEESPVKKGKLGGTLRMADLATPPLNQTTQPKPQATTKLHEPTAGGVHRVDQASYGHTSSFELMSKQQGSKSVESSIEPSIEAAAYALAIHRTKENKQPDNQETHSSRGPEIENRDQQTGNDILDEAQLLKRRATAEKSAFRRWEKKAAEKRAKGEEPEAFHFVYRPKGSYKKKDPNGEKQDNAEAAKKEKKPKPRTPRRKKSLVIASIKRNVHQAAANRGSLFGNSQEFEDSETNASGNELDSGDDVQMEDVKDAADPQAEEVDLWDTKDPEDTEAMLEENGNSSGSSDRGLFVGSDESSVDMSNHIRPSTAATSFTSIDQDETHFSHTADPVAVPSFNLTDEELNISAEPDIPNSTNIMGKVDVPDAPTLGEMAMGDIAMEDPHYDLFNDTDPTVNPAGTNAEKPNRVAETQSANEATSRSGSPSGLVGSIEATTSNAADLGLATPPKTPQRLPPTTKPSVRSNTAPAAQHTQQPTQGFLTQLLPSALNESPVTREKKAQPDVIDFDVSEEPTVGVPQAVHESLAHASSSKDHSSASLGSAVNNQRSFTKANTPEQTIPSSSSADPSNSRNGQNLPKVKKFLKLPLSHWAWVVAEQFLRTGRAEAQDFNFLREYRKDLQDIYNLNKAQEDLDNGVELEMDEPTTKKQRRPSAGKVKASTKAKAVDSVSQAPSIGRGGSQVLPVPAEPKAAPKPKIKTAPTPRRPQAHSRSPVPPGNETAAKPPPVPPRRSRQPQTSALVAPKRQQQKPRIEPPHIEKPRIEKPRTNPPQIKQPRIEPPRAEVPRVDSLTPEPPPRPRFGGKGLPRPQFGGKGLSTPEWKKYNAEVQKRQQEEPESDELEVVGEDEDEEVATESERGREASPITKEDELHYSYHVWRKQWRAEDFESDADWVHVGPQHLTRDAAINAAYAESKVLRHGMIWDAMNGACSFGLCADRGIAWIWKGDMHNGHIRVKVQQILHAAGSGTLPASKSGWLPSIIWRIKKEVWLRTKKVTALPPVAALDQRDEEGDRDENAVDESEDGPDNPVEDGETGGSSGMANVEHDVKVHEVEDGDSSLDELFEDKDEGEIICMTDAGEHSSENRDDNAEPDRKMSCKEDAGASAKIDGSGKKHNSDEGHTIDESGGNDENAATTNAKDATNDDEDDDEDHYDLIPQVCEQPENTYTTLDYANRMAMARIIDEFFGGQGSRKIDDVNGRREIEKWYEEAKVQELALDVEEIVEKGTRKVRYWVEEVRLLGPKNA